MDLRGEELNRGPIVVFWSHGDKRRVIIPVGWAEAKALWKRVLGRFRGGQSHYLNCQGELGRLRDIGAPLVASFGRHIVGVVRSYQLEELRGAEPVMVCKERGPTGREPRVPILVRDVEVARELVTRFRDRGITISDWRCYAGEHLDLPLEKLIRRLPDGSVVGRTILEDELVACFGVQGRARQAFPPLPAYTEPDLPAWSVPSDVVPSAEPMAERPIE